MSMNMDIMKTVKGFCKKHDITPEDAADLYMDIRSDLEWDFYDEAEDTQSNIENFINFYNEP